MINYLVALHAALGEIGSFSFLWIFVELLNPTASRVLRAKKAGLIGLLSFLGSWISGGYYYLAHYGPYVKPLIKGGPSPWAHTVVMEVKEHVFLLLLVLALTTYIIIKNSEDKIINDKNYRQNLLILVASVFLVGMSMAGLGYLVTLGLRLALELRSSL